MKTFNLIFGILTLLTTNLLAQPNADRIESMRVGFITQKLELTSQEAQVFWPVYNDGLERVKKTHKAAKKMLQEQDIEELTDADLEKNIDAALEAEAQEAQIKKETFLKLKKVLPIRKLAKLYKIEIEFKKTLLREVRNRMDGGQPPRNFRN